MKLVIAWIDGLAEDFTLPKDAKVPGTNIGLEWAEWLELFTERAGWLIFHDSAGTRHYINLQHVRGWKVIP